MLMILITNFPRYFLNPLIHINLWCPLPIVDAVTIVLFKVLGAFANRPFDTSLTDDERNIDVGDVSDQLK